MVLEQEDRDEYVMLALKTVTIICLCWSCSTFPRFVLCNTLQIIEHHGVATFVIFEYWQDRQQRFHFTAEVFPTFDLFESQDNYSDNTGEGKGIAHDPFIRGNRGYKTRGVELKQMVACTIRHVVLGRGDRENLMKQSFL